MGALINLAGQQFGRLRVIKRLPDRVGPSGSRQPRWGCVCLCGRTTVEEGRALRGRRAMSCRVCVRDPSRMLKYGRVYLMYFPRWHVLKIGFHTSAVRTRELMAAGGYLIDEYRDVDKSWETHGILALAELFPPAFDSREDARRVLPRGSGWTDSFIVDPDDLDLAKWAVMRAGIRKGNDFGQNPPATPLWRATLDGFQRARRRARVRRADAARAAGAGGVGVPDPAGSGVDREAVVPGVPAGHVDGSRDPRRPRAGGHRPRPHVGAERPRVACPAPVWARTRACSGPSRPALDLTPGRGIFTSLGGGKEREGARAQAGASEDARARAREVMDAEDLELAERWESAYSKPAPRARPKRPAILQAPPLGCQEHPQGTLEDCGPCGTAAERRRVFLARHKYEQQLALFEESQWEDMDHEPF